MADHESKNDVSHLSEHIFWDTDLSSIDWWEHRKFIFERVMTYGLLEDWRVVKDWYTKEEMQKMVASIKNLDDFSIAFLSLVLDIPKNNFRCYIERQLSPNFWHY